MKFIVICILLAFMYWMYTNLRAGQKHQGKMAKLQKELNRLNAEFSTSRQKWYDALKNDVDHDDQIEATRIHLEDLDTISRKIEDVTLRIDELDRKM